MLERTGSLDHHMEETSCQLHWAVTYRRNILLLCLVTENLRLVTVN